MKPLSPATLRAHGASLGTVLRVAVSAPGATLDSMLCAAGYSPIEQRLIDAHKAAELAKAPRADLMYHFLTLFRFVFFCSFCACVASVFATIVCVLGIIAAYAGSLFDGSYAPALKQIAVAASPYCLTATVVSLIATALFAWFSEKEVRGPATWVKLWYGSIHGCMVPMEAMLLANAAFALKADSQVIVHVLIQNKVILDPILEIDGRYVLVWDKDGNIIDPQYTNPPI